MKRIIYLIILFFITIIPGTLSQAGSISTLNTFTEGAVASATEVNENFNAVQTAVNDNDSRIAELEAAVASLQSTVLALQEVNDELNARLEAVESNSVLALNGYLTFVDNDINGYPSAQFSGLNVWVVNGSGDTSGDPNGLGNLIVGYNELRGADDYRTGSHNIVGGKYNNYLSYGGFIVGYSNEISEEYCSVSGGRINTVSGPFSSISGGESNIVTNVSSASISGGNGNTASGQYSSVSGGYMNTADGDASSVSGGSSRSVSGEFNWAAGSQFEAQ